MLRASLFVSLASAVLFAGTAHAGMTGQPQASSMSTSSGSSFDFANDATYSSGYGMSAGEENVAASGATRDANGNLVIVNGQMGTGNMTSLQGARQSGVGYGNGGGSNASATAIGNQLNVVVAGSWNTVVVDSTQINNGDQTANASLNGKLNF